MLNHSGVVLKSGRVNQALRWPAFLTLGVEQGHVRDVERDRPAVQRRQLAILGKQRHPP